MRHSRSATGVVMATGQGGGSDFAYEFDVVFDGFGHCIFDEVADLACSDRSRRRCG